MPETSDGLHDEGDEAKQNETEALGELDGPALMRGPFDGLEQLVQSYRITEARGEG